MKVSGLIGNPTLTKNQAVQDLAFLKASHYVIYLFLLNIPSWREEMNEKDSGR